LLVVVRSMDGRVVKGRTTDFHPEADHFHVQPRSGVSPERIEKHGLKAVFFVRSLEGNPDYQDHREFRSEAGVRRKLWIEFKDGEQMAAWPVSAFLGQEGFYALPTDRASNLEKAYVFRDAVRTVLQNREADRAAAEESRKRRSETIVQLVGSG
jgi:Family of unknown function (DUF6982)